MLEEIEMGKLHAMSARHADDTPLVGFVSRTHNGAQRGGHR